MINTFDYDNTHSKWIDIIARSSQQWEGMVIVNVMYSNKKAQQRKVYDVYFWVSLEEHELLANAPSQGSHYWYNWSVYGNPKTRYTGQDKNGSSNENEDSEVPKVLKKYEDGTALSDDVIDGQIIKIARQQQELGTLDDYLEDEYGNDPIAVEQINKWVSRLDIADDLFERTTAMRTLIETEQLTTKQMFKTFMLDIQEFAGVSFSKSFMFKQLSQVSGGKLNPNKWISYKFKLKGIYDAVDKEGVKGLQGIGKRIIGAKNPLVRSREAYKGKEAVKSLFRDKKWLDGEEGLEAVNKFHNKALKESARGFKKANSMNLEQNILVNGKKVYRWKKNVSVGRKILTTTKKVLRIAKWFI